MIGHKNKVKDVSQQPSQNLKSNTMKNTHTKVS